MNKAASVIVCALCACSFEVKDPANDPDPLVALEASTQTTMYTDAFWSNEAERNSELWGAALAKCQPESALKLPNCSFVRREREERALRKGMPTSTEYQPTVDLLRLRRSDPKQETGDKK